MATTLVILLALIVAKVAFSLPTLIPTVLGFLAKLLTYYGA